MLLGSRKTFVFYTSLHLPVCIRFIEAYMHKMILQDTQIAIDPVYSKNELSIIF